MCIHCARTRGRYHDHVHEINGTNSGLVGAIIVTAKAHAAADGSGSPGDVDVEVPLLFAAFNENSALYAEQNIRERLDCFAGNDAQLDEAARAGLTRRLRVYDDKFKDSMRKRAINGRLQCSLGGLRWAVGQRVRLHLLSVGDEELHTPTLVGHTLLHRGHRSQTVGLMASSMKSVDLVSSAPGSFLLRSGSLSGVERGMSAMATVTGEAPGSAAEPSRTYYIAADEVQWDFLPAGHDACAGHGQERAHTTHATELRSGGPAGGGSSGFNGWDEPANGVELEYDLYTSAADYPQHIGSSYVMALFRE